VYWGEEGESQADTYERDKNIKNAVESLGFTGYSPSKYNKSLNDPDGIAFSVSRRDNLLAVIVRGGGYGAEWADNFNVGDNGEYHRGFYDASTEIIEAVDKYITDNGIEGTIKFWVAGFSRGGGAANITAARLSDTFGAENVYAYTFAAPNTVINPKEYANIFNIVNPSDIVPAVPLSEWGFTRYGQQINLNETTQFTDKIQNINDVLYDLSPTPEEWELKWQKVISEYMLLLNTRQKASTGNWTDTDISSEFIKKHGIGNLTRFHQVSLIILAFSDYDGEILSHVNVFLSLCTMYDVDMRELFGNIGNVITTVEFLRAASALYADYKNDVGIRYAHLPENYVGWMYER
jgi:hypothetical protein